jgi:hypothetical protein
MLRTNAVEKIETLHVLFFRNIPYFRDDISKEPVVSIFVVEVCESSKWEKRWLTLNILHGVISQEPGWLSR